MFKRVLVPLDGSVRAERAIPVAARIAHASGGSVVLLRVAPIPIDYGLMTPSVNYVEDIVDTELSGAGSYLEAVSKSSVLAGVAVETSTLVGIPAQTILAAVESYHIDLIVMCSHGNTGFKRWVLGSVAQKLVRYSPVPVFVLREGGAVPAHPHPDARPMRALVALDGSALAKAALMPAAYLVSALSVPGQGALHLTRVVKPLFNEERNGQSDFADNLKERNLYKAKKYLSSIVDHLRDGLVADFKLATTWSVAVDADVPHTLIRVAENGEDAEGAGVFGGCDFIAMATHGRSGLERWAMGSVTEHVLGATRLPMLIVRPQQVETKQELHGEEFAEVGIGGIHMGSSLF